MTKQELIERINQLLIDNKIEYKCIDESKVKVIDLSAILNFFHHSNYFYPPEESLYMTMDMFDTFFKEVEKDGK